MKIVIVTPYYAPAWAYGGPPKLLHEFAQALKQRGHNVKIISCDVLDHRRSKPYYDLIEGISVYRLKTLSNTLAWKQKIFLPLGATRYLTKTLKNVDFVFCSDLRHLLNISVYKVCKKFNIPYSIAAYGEISITHDWKSIFKKIYDVLYGYRIAKKARFLLAQTKHEMEAYKKYVGSQKSITLFPLALDMSPFKKLPPKNSFRQKFNLSSHDKVVLFVGRFNAYKGIDLLLKSVTALRKKLPRLKLVLVGRDDGYLSEINKTIKILNLENMVIITSPLFNDDVIAAYSDADVFVITPPHSEETSLASLAALACGCPVIVNENCQIPWLDANKAGITIKAHKKPEKALQTMLSSAKLRQQMSHHARILAFKKYNWEQRAKDFENLISLK